MRIIQLLTSISYGDAVSNDVIALQEVLWRNGYATAIYAENIDTRISEKLAKRINKMPKLKKEDIILYHLSTGTELNYRLTEYPARKIVIYHNVTPSYFFKGYSKSMEELCAKGIAGLQYLVDKVDYCIADSEYNRQDMVGAGYRCKIDVLPILIPFSDYKKKPDSNVIRRYGDDGYTNILFTGRLAPNKKQEDVISAFYMYQKYYNPKSRLFLVGSYRGMQVYYQRLKGYAEKLGVKNVFFTGLIKFEEILAYYSIADLFLCMSEHEGFCVPLAEAMCFDVPIVAYDSSAIGDTLGGAGVLLKDKNHMETAGVIHYIMNDEKIRAQIIKGQQERLRHFEHDRIEQQFLKYINQFLGD